jgi:hypothetical protein
LQWADRMVGTARVGLLFNQERGRWSRPSGLGLSVTMALSNATINPMRGKEVEQTTWPG